MDELTKATLRFIGDPKSQPMGDNELFARLAVEKPVIRAGTVWIISRHDLVTKLARHPAGALRMPDEWSATRHLDEAASRILDGLLPIQPPADHQRLRRLLASQFSAKSVAGLRPDVRAIVADLLAGPLRQGECEFVGEVCGPLPVYTTAAMLGLPPEDRPRVLGWASAVNSAVVNEVTGRVGGRYGTPGSAAETGIAEVIGYINELVATRGDGDDLISRLKRASSEEDGRLSHDELVSMVLMLFMTGIDTVGSALANVVLALHRHPAAWRRVVADPSLAAAAYVEGIRLYPPLPLMSRIAESDIELDGITIPKGSTMLLLYGAANLDPAVFTDPLAFDLDRTESRHLAFGHGPHYCLGASLAVLQGELVLAALAAHTPDFSLVDTALRRRDEMAFHSPAELHVGLAPRSATSTADAPPMSPASEIPAGCPFSSAPAGV
ncbi:MAG: Cytochrome [Amycolatopsis sp.]|jgi:cytochrome P450|uniref:cytochrome P450 n=1 Tax=Amycolatopsis sp. TaxID=37632 RepID=UPI002635E019|nr:cytochrome P450 [Amycolatopsis sp.]MCU1680035.1 Cytochrome [Amycolatopsis sp.]